MYPPAQIFLTGSSKVLGAARRGAGAGAGGGRDGAFVARCSLGGVRLTEFWEKMNAQFGMGSVGFLIWSKTLGASAGWDVAPGDPTEAVMRAQQEQLALKAGALPDGHLITDGYPNPGGSAGQVAAPAMSAPPSVVPARASAQTIAVAQSSAPAQPVVASIDASRATGAVRVTWAYHPPR